MKKLILFIFITNFCVAQKNFFFTTNNVTSVLVRLNGDSGDLPLDQIPNPFEYGVSKGTKIDFVLPNDSIAVVIDEDLHISIARIDKKDTIRIVFKSVQIVTFDEIFKKKKNGKIDVDIPEVYELMNILMAISTTGKNDENMIEKSSDYYADVKNHFDAFKNEKAVMMIDQMLKENKYYELKMDSYSFIIENNQIKSNPNYHVINWSNVNTISKDLLAEMQVFMLKSKILLRSRKIYKKECRCCQND
jgi:hypothetical protein